MFVVSVELLHHHHLGMKLSDHLFYTSVQESKALGEVSRGAAGGGADDAGLANGGAGGCRLYDGIAGGLQARIDAEDAAADRGRWRVHAPRVLCCGFAGQGRLTSSRRCLSRQGSCVAMS